MDAFEETGFWESAAEGIVILDGWVVGVKGEFPEHVILPEGTRGVADDAFENCAADCECETCSQLTAVVIPGSVKTIGRDAFYGCEDLEIVVILDGVREIGDDAFAYCTGLASVVIPASVEGIESIERDAFLGCEKMKLIRS